MNLKKMNKGLDFLRDKYAAAKGEITVKDGHCYVGAVPLLPGRMERKIVELKKMTENGTLEGVSTLRFAAFVPKGTDVKEVLAKELDLAAYLGASDIVRVMAAGNGEAINVLAKLANDVNVSVEVAASLPKGEAAFDRHEIIAKRGVACDQTVDTHTPHSSIRCYGAKGAIASCANVAPRIAVDIYEKFMAGDHKGALDAQFTFSALRISTNMGTFPVVLKEALKMIGLDCGDCVKPIQPLNDEQRAKLRGVLSGMGLL